MAHRVAKVASGDQLGLEDSVMDNGRNMHVYTIWSHVLYLLALCSPYISKGSCTALIEVCQKQVNLIRTPSGLLLNKANVL
jgi:hypothetical protein